MLRTPLPRAPLSATFTDSTGLEYPGANCRLGEITLDRTERFSKIDQLLKDSKLIRREPMKSQRETMKMFLPNWEKFDADTFERAASKSFCLYVFHHPDDGGRPFYIGKAKYFGPRQESGYERGARYNAGYQHLLEGMLRSGFGLYIAEIGEAQFKNAEAYEQYLISAWNPVRKQRTSQLQMPISTTIPWS
jgi:hypothetical protein